MPDNNLKKKVVGALLWNSFGKFGTVIITFISNMVLARMLMPEDFGYIGMLSIFVSLSDVIAIGGFGQALVQKENPQHIDYSTVFIWNLFASTLLYLVLFFCAPLIANFYEMPLLRDILRVQSLTIIIHALIVIQNNQLQKNLRFKEYASRNVIAAIAGTSVAIVMAYKGFGVWSLVASSITSGICSVFLLWNMSKWRPTLEFNWKSFKDLFSFGGLIALSDIFEKVYTNIQGLIIGKLFSAKEMGYYSQAYKLEQIPINTFTQTVAQVSFPLFSTLQSNRNDVRKALKKNIVCLSYINFPLSAIMIILAVPLIHLFYGYKWDAAIPYFKIMCLAGMVSSLTAMNLNVIKGLGKGKLFLFAKLINRVIGISVIIIGASRGIYGIIWSMVIVSYIEFFIYTLINKKLVGYGFLPQIRDVLKNVLVTTMSSMPTFLIGKYVIMQEYLIMIFQLFVFIVVYLLTSWMFRVEAFKTYKNIVLNRIKRK